MKEYQVTCINKPHRMSPHEHIGNTANNWRLTREEAIRRIDAHEEAFYTVDKTTGRSGKHSKMSKQITSMWLKKEKTIGDAAFSGTLPSDSANEDGLSLAPHCRLQNIA